MNSQNSCRSREKRNAPQWGTAFAGILCGALAAVILVITCQAQTAPEKPANQSEPTQSASIYDPDPNHLWNRLFVTFYRQKVSSYVDYHRDKTVTNWVGPDVLDPPLGHHPCFLLDDEPFFRCNAVLDEFLNQQGAKLIHDPLKHVVLQRDLWAVFDLLVQINPTNAIAASGFASGTPTPLPLTPSQQEHQITLERKIALTIHSLALSRAEINNLPDTYSAAIRSVALTSKHQAGDDNFPPHDLFATNGTWFEVNPGDPRLQHSLMVGGRSVFRNFVKSPAGFTNVLGDLIRDEEQWSRQRPMPQRPSGKLPVGTQFLLLREMICLDENLQMVPTHVVESVQFRTTSQDWFSDRLIGREAELSRILLFQNKQGGLRPIMAGEPRVAGYGSLGHLEVDSNGNSISLMVFPENCAACHQTRAGVSRRLFFPYPKASSKPVRSTSIESISRWKEKTGNLNQLRELILSPDSNEK